MIIPNYYQSPQTPPGVKASTSHGTIGTLEAPRNGKVVSIHEASDLLFLSIFERCSGKLLTMTPMEIPAGHQSHLAPMQAIFLELKSSYFMLENF